MIWQKKHQPLRDAIDISLYTVSDNSDPEMFPAPLERVHEAMLTVKTALRELQPRLAECGVTKMYIYPETAREDAINVPGIDVRMHFGCLGKEGGLSVEQESAVEEILNNVLIPRNIGAMIVDYPTPRQSSNLQRRLGLKELCPNQITMTF